MITEEDHKFVAECDDLASVNMCSHRDVGAIVIGKKGDQLGSGRNLSVPLGDPSNCVEGSCPRGLLPPGRGASDYSDCNAVHAEFFAIASALGAHGTMATVNGTMYVNSMPCPMCFRLCMSVSIRRVVWRGDDGILQERKF